MLNSYIKKMALLVLFMTASIVIWITVMTIKPWLSSEEILQRFYANPLPEETLMDPLIVGGRKVASLVVEKVQQPNMPRRRYAIAFLGNEAYKEAIPVLEGIMRDENEIDYFRGDALVAIYSIDRTKGKEFASNYKLRPDYLGEMARIIQGDAKWLSERRSYWDAFMVCAIEHI